MTIGYSLLRKWCVPGRDGSPDAFDRIECNRLAGQLRPERTFPHFCVRRVGESDDANEFNTSRLPKERPSAFTLIELLVVIGIIGILSTLVVTALSVAKRKGQGSYCINNIKQLQIALHLYAEDHQGRLPRNKDGQNAGKDTTSASWVAGWLQLDDRAGDKTENTNIDMLIGQQYTAFGSIGRYSGEPKLYHCPSDKSTATVLGSVQSRVRTVSMSMYMNGAGQWQNPAYLTFTRFTDIISLDPAKAWMLIDEREDSINDGYFAVVMDQKYAILDVPGNYHAGAATFSFADGHVEPHKWLQPTTTPRLVSGQSLPLGVRPTTASDQDMAWLIQHTTTLK